MDINLGEEKIVELVASFSDEDIRTKALAKRLDAFGQLAKFMQRPKLEEIEIVQTEKRLNRFGTGRHRRVIATIAVIATRCLLHQRFNR